jgi:hypothetical protein
MNKPEGIRDFLFGWLNLFDRIDSILGLGVLLVSVFAALLVFTFGPNVTLTCTRQDASDVYCQFETRAFLLGGMLGGILHVQKAVNEEQCSGLSCVYRVVLETTDGKESPTDEYTSSSKADIVNRLNAFINDQSQTENELAYGGGITSQFMAILNNCIIPLLIMVVAVMGLMFLYRGFQSIKRKATRVH